MKKKVFLYVVLCLLLTGIVFTGFAINKVKAEEVCQLEVGKTYNYTEEGTIAEFIIEENNKYRCNVTHGETLVGFNGTYTYENEIINFYFGEELFEQYTIGENYTLINYSSTIENSVNNELKEDVEWLNNFKNWLITGIVSILGSSSVCVIFRKILKKIIEDLNKKRDAVKEDSDNSIKKIDEAYKILQDEREQFEKDKQEFFKKGLKFYENSKDAIILMACGIQELVENGTAERIKEMLNGEDKEI